MGDGGIYWKTSGGTINNHHSLVLSVLCSDLFLVPKTHIPVGRVVQVKKQQDLEERKIPASLSTGVWWCGNSLTAS